uniref:Uncharacterized protein n=1 Tax=Photinus pyralis TaxID=7054 RepID=A0A1Y1KKM9_PHOPY
MCQFFEANPCIKELDILNIRANIMATISFTRIVFTKMTMKAKQNVIQVTVLNARNKVYRSNVQLKFLRKYKKITLVSANLPPVNIANMPKRHHKVVRSLFALLLKSTTIDSFTGATSNKAYHFFSLSRISTDSSMQNQEKIQLHNWHVTHIK